MPIHIAAKVLAMLFAFNRQNRRLKLAYMFYRLLLLIIITMITATKESKNRLIVFITVGYTVLVTYLYAESSTRK